VLLLLVALVLGVGAFNLPLGEPPLIQVWLAFIAYGVVLALPFIWYRPSWGWLHPLVFLVLWAELARSVLRKISIYATGLPAHDVMPAASSAVLNGVVTEALLLKAVGLMAMYTGFMSAGRLTAPRLEFKQPNHLALKTGVLTAVSLLALLMLVNAAGSVGALMLQRGLPAEARIFTDPNMRIAAYMVGLLKPACLVWFALKPKAWRSPVWLAFFGIAMLIGFMATGSRSGVAIPVLQAGVIWILHNRRIPYQAIVIGFVFSMLVLGIGGAFRQASTEAESLAEVEVDVGLVNSVTNGFQGMVRYGASHSGYYAILASVPDNVGFLWGESYLSIPVAPIPSAVLPFEKPEAGGKLNAKRIFSIRSGGVPPGSIGEAYWNFGIPGVIVVMALFGVVLKWFYRLYVVNQARGWVMVVYVITLFSLRPSSPPIYGWLHAMVPIAIYLILFCGFPATIRRDRHQAPWTGASADLGA